MNLGAFPERDADANGIRMHYADAGAGHPVLLCHGFPEGWYAWRHQIADLAAAGFRAIVPDLRGYGDTDAPAAIADYTIMHLVGDMVGLLNALDIARASIVGHDWGAVLAWHAATMRPDRFVAVAGLSVPFVPRGPMSGLEAARRAGRHDHYQLYFQEPGLAERAFEQDLEATMRRSFWTLSAGPGTIWDGRIGPGGLFDAFVEPTAPMEWLSDSDIVTAAAAFRRNGFRGPLNWYRNLDLNWTLTAPFQGAVPAQPSLYLVGDRDPVFPIYRTAADSLSRILPGLRASIVVPGAGHWIQQEAPAAVSKALITFLSDVAPA